MLELKKAYLLPLPPEPTTGMLGLGFVGVTIFSLAGAVVTFMIGNRILEEANKKL